jgi:hypothetical protein
MSMDFKGSDSDTPITDQEGVMFAAQPVWERNRKRKGFGGRKTASAAPAATVVTPEPRSFAAERDYEEPMALDRPVDRPTAATIASTPVYPRTEYAAMGASTTNSTLAADEPIGLAAPIGGTRNTRSTKSNSVAPAAIAAAVVGLGALGAAGWYMSRDTSGVPELAAGSTATESELAAAPLTPTDPPAQVAVNEAAPPPVATPRAESNRVTVPARATARARPAAAAPSAGETGVNASTTAVLPDGPQPYAATPGTTAPTQVNPPLVALPPSSETPAAVPATPPTLPQDPPATQAPEANPVTPPQ